MKTIRKNIEKCDECGQPLLDEKFDVYDENFNKEKDVMHCRLCFIKFLEVDNNETTI